MPRLSEQRDAWRMRIRNAPDRELDPSDINDFAKIQEQEAEHYRLRRRSKFEPTPMNPYTPPQPQYVSEEMVSLLIDSRFNELKGMLSMALVGIFLMVIVLMTVAVLILTHYGVTP